MKTRTHGTTIVSFFHVVLGVSSIVLLLCGDNFFVLGFSTRNIIFSSIRGQECRKRTITNPKNGILLNLLNTKYNRNRCIKNVRQDPIIKIIHEKKSCLYSAIKDDTDMLPPPVSKNPKPSLSSSPSSCSKRSMISFAIPALGIFLSAPLLSNIDNVFVGRSATGGAIGLASLSPATLCTDQALYLFSFLSRATTGIVSRAYDPSKADNNNENSNENSSQNSSDASKADNNNENSNENSSQNSLVSNSSNAATAAARDAAAAPLTVSLLCGIALSLVYTLFTPVLLSLLTVDPTLHAPFLSYVRWRGASLWAALFQNASLSILLAVGDAMTPLKIIGLSSLLNIIGDAILCPQFGVAGAAAATSLATLCSVTFMLRALKERQLLPHKLHLPSLKQAKSIAEYMGPLLAIACTRTVGLIAMQRAATRMGVTALASYHVCANALGFFLLFGEPLNQLHQTRLPRLIDGNDDKGVFQTIRNVMMLAVMTAVTVGVVAFGTLRYGASMFTGDGSVVQAVAGAAPAVLGSVIQVILTIALDGAMLASRDFGFVVMVGLLTCGVEVALVKKCQTISAIFGVFALRRLIYALAAVIRGVVLGRGTLGKMFKRYRKKIELENVFSKENVPTVPTTNVGV